jgi:TolB protein
MAARLTAMRLFLYLAITLLSLHIFAVGTVIAATQQLPAGQIIAYVSADDAGEDIFVFDVNRAIARNLTHHMEQSNEREPAWSPDGSQIAFSSWHQTFQVANIYVMDMDGSNLRQLTHLDTDYDFSPAWSPDGQQIAFVGYRGRRSDLSVMDASGENVRPLTDTDIPKGTPTWSSDGNTLAFTAYHEQGGNSIYLVEGDGSHERPLIPGNYFAPAWSPDGAYIAFMRGDRQAQIFVMETGSGTIQAFTIPGNLDSLTWLPDSQRIAFVSDYASGTPEVFVLDIATGDQSRLPFGGYGGYVPQWRPT